MIAPSSHGQNLAEPAGGSTSGRGAIAPQPPPADASWVGFDLAGAGPTQISTYIRTMLQDRAGAIWFGTQDDGVCRYDGKALACFSESAGLGGSAVRDILEDRNGNLWFANSGGVSRYDGKAKRHFQRHRASRSWTSGAC